MVNTGFNSNMVWAVGKVDPPIERPFERFKELVGPWVQPLGDARYLVSPLLQTAWQDYIPPDLKKRLHGAIAREYLQGSVN